MISTYRDLAGDDSDYTQVVTHTRLSLPESQVFLEGTDGPIIWLDEWTYDDFGNLLRHERDDLGDGIVDSFWLRSYDAYGRLLLWQYDRDANGTVDSDRQYSYNDYGDLLTESHDTDADGMPEDIWRFGYDTFGRRNRESHDRGADGTVDSVRHLLWSKHLLAEVEQDDGADGSVDYSQLLFYDAADRIERIDFYHRESETRYQFRTFGYEMHGWLSSVEFFRPHLEGAVHYLYDGAGRLTETRMPLAGEVWYHTSQCPRSPAVGLMASRTIARQARRSDPGLHYLVPAHPPARHEEAHTNGRLIDASNTSCQLCPDRLCGVRSCGDLDVEDLGPAEHMCCYDRVHRGHPGHSTRSNAARAVQGDTAGGQPQNSGARLCH